MEHYPRQLSAGRSSGVAIARAIVTTRRFWSRMNRRATWTRNLRKTSALAYTAQSAVSQAIVMVTHDPRSERFVDTIIVSTKGIHRRGEKGGISAKPRVSLRSSEQAEQA